MARRCAVSPVVDELEGEVELLALQQRDDGLQIVLLLGRDAQLLALDLGPDALRPLVPDDLRQLLGVVLADALLEGDSHPVFLAGELGIARVQGLERHAAPDQLVLEHVEDGLGAFLAVGPDVDGVLAGPGDGRAHAAEVEPGTYFLGRLVERVVNFLAVELGHDVKGRLLGCHGSQARRASRAPSRRTRRPPVRPGPTGRRLTVSSCLGLSFSMPPARTAHGRLPEWPKGAVCKTVGSAYVGSNPTPATTCENGPLARNSRLCGPFLLCPVVCHLVALRADVSRCPRTHSGRDSCPITVGAHRRLFHGRPRTGRAGGMFRLDVPPVSR